jgi:hypothetical protein
MLVMETIKSSDLREELSEVLSKVHYGGQVVKVSRYRTPMAFVVPPDWYMRACEALGVDPEHPELLGSENPSS